jgi:predicted RND superfamily exporter protein
MLRAWATLVVRHPRAVLVVVLLVTVALATQLRHLRLDIRERDQLPQDHFNVQLYNRINDLFGGGAVIVVGIVAKQGDIFDREMLAKVARITTTIEQLPETAGGSVRSIAAQRVRGLKGTADGIEINSLMPAVPEGTMEIARLRDDVHRDPLYNGTLVSISGDAAAVVAEVSVDAPYPQLHAKLEAIAAAERDERADVVLSGAPIMLSYTDQYTAQMALLFPLAVVVIGLIHYEAFRTLQAMFLPLVTALLSVLWALGIMGTMGAPIDSWSAITPVAILAIAAGHAVQILKRYYEELTPGGDSATAVVSSVAKVGPTMLTAGLIASAGFASLATFQVTSVRVFGLLMACGIISALAIEMTFIPACRALLPAPRGREAQRERESPWVSFLLQRLAILVLRRPEAVIAVTTAVAIAFLGGVRALEVDSSLRGYFSADSRARLDDAVINDRFAGASVMKILIEGESGALRAPEVLHAISDLQGFLQGFPEVGKTVSVVDYVTRMNQAMHGDDPSAATIPSSAALIAQYLLLYSPEDLNDLVDADYRSGVVMALCKSDAAGFATNVFGRTREFAERRFAGLPVSVGIAGGSLGAQAALNEVIVAEKIRNTMQVALIIFSLSALALRSVVAGVLVLAPLALAVVVTLGAMGWTHTWLSMSTATITAMAISIGADFAIYLIFRLQQELEKHDLESAIRETLLTAGKAIFFVSSAVTLGYLVLAVSRFAAWVQLGVITALMMMVSSLAALTLLPALVLLLRPRFLWRSRVAFASQPADTLPSQSTAR